jgi:hypothetical protein
LTAILGGIALWWSAQPGVFRGAEPAPSADKPAETNADVPTAAKRADGAANAKPADAKPAEAPLREQDIYIPYDKLREVFEKAGRGVFLPYEQFEELWKAARAKTAKPPEEKPPVGALITEVENEATVGKDVVEVKAAVKIEVLAEGWTEVPLRLADAAITSATVDDQPARILGGPQQNYRLLVENKGKEPKQVALTLHYAKAIEKSPGVNAVSFQAPLAPVSRWRVRIPQSGVKVDIHPVIAATQQPAEAREGQPKPPEETVVLAFVGAAPMVRIEWTPKAEGATGLTALAGVQAEQQVWVNEGVTRTRVRLVYEISRAELAALRIEVPADQKVVNVLDANVRQWSIEKPADEAAAAAAKTQVVVAQLFEPAKAKQEVAVELEKFSRDEQPGKQQTIDVPLVRALDVSRQQGVVVVQVAAGLRAEAAGRAGLLQVDKSELPATLARGDWTFAYRYGAVPFALSLVVEKIQPRVLVDSLVEAYLQPQQLAVDMASVYTIERAGVFRLEIDVPETFHVAQVHGRAMPDAQPAQIEAHHVEGEKKNRLIVDLSAKAMGKIGLVVQLERDLDAPDLLTPTGKTVAIPLPIPRVAPGTVERAVGRLILYAPESLHVNPSKTTGLRPVPFAEALQGMQSARDAKPEGLRPTLAFAYTPEPVALDLSVERRKPQITIKQLFVARIEDGVVKYESTLYYDILYSGVESLQAAVPQDVAAEIRIKTPGIRREVLDPQPKDLPKGSVAWRLVGESELFGQGEIKLVWEKKMDKLEIGKGQDLAIPRVKPLGVDRAWGQIVLAKAETLDIRESGTPENLRPIDPQQDLIAPVAGAARAFEFHDDWTLAILVTRYQLEEVKRTNIELGVVRMVVTRSNQVSVQALYRMRSARQRLEVKLPEGAGQETEARLGGRPVMLQGSKDDPTVRFIPLVDSNPDEPFLLELRYLVAGDGGSLELPVFAGDPSAQKVYLAAYLPKEWALMGTAGPWTTDYGWELDSPWRWTPDGQWRGDQLVNQVQEGVPSAGAGAEKFQTDGYLYLFYTLRPEAPPQGALHLTTISATMLRALLFVVVFAGGLLLLPVGYGPRTLTIGILIVALVLLGVFAPNFSMQILNGILAVAILLVLVIWIAVWLARRQPTWSWPGAKHSDADIVGRDSVPSAESPVAAEAVEDTPIDFKPIASEGESPPLPPADAPAPDDAEKKAKDDNPSEEGGRTDA